jgi:hypothetical protein
MDRFEKEIGVVKAMMEERGIAIPGERLPTDIVPANDGGGGP